MTAKIRVVGHLKDYTSGRAELEVESGRSVRETLTALGLNPEVVALVVVNEATQDKDYIIHDGDLVRVIAVIGGG